MVQALEEPTLWRWWPCGKADICAMCQCVECDQRNKVAELCSTLCNPMDYTVHGFLQARILEWVAFPFSRRSSQPKNRIVIKCNRYQFCITCQGKCFSCISAISHPVSGFSEPCFKLMNNENTPKKAEQGGNSVSRHLSEAEQPRQLGHCTH